MVFGTSGILPKQQDSRHSPSHVLVANVTRGQSKANTSSVFYSAVQGAPFYHSLSAHLANLQAMFCGGVVGGCRKVL